MALSANTVFEVRTAGSDSNGGGFVTGASGTDFSQQNAPQVTLTTASVVAATTTQISVSAGDHIVAAADVGNIFQLAGGSATAGFYQITAVNTGTNTWTLDRSVGTAGQTCPGNMGGAFASPGKAASAATVNGHKVFIKYTAATPYVITTASTNVAGGCVSGTAGTYWAGYDTTRALYTPFQNRPTLQLGTGVTAATIFGNLNVQYSLQGVILDCNLQTTSKCYNSSGEAFYVKAMNFTSLGIVQNTGTLRAILCEVTGGTSAAANDLSAQFALWCVSHDNTQIAANSPGNSSIYCYGCVSYNNSQDGFGSIGGGTWVNCASYNNGARGFYLGNAATIIVSAINCISEANGTFGYFVNSGPGQLINCADYNNVSGRKNTASLWNTDVNPIVGTSSFFNAPGSGDFRLSAAGFALCKAAGFPTNMPSPADATTNFLDVNVVQHLDLSPVPTLALGI